MEQRGTAIRAADSLKASEGKWWAPWDGRPSAHPLLPPTDSCGGWWRRFCCALVLGLIIYAAVQNASENLARAKIASGFGFWNVTSGFDISQTLIDYSPQTSTNGDAFWVGLLNTLLVAGLGILFATAIGFASALHGCPAISWWSGSPLAMSN